MMQYKINFETMTIKKGDNWTVSSTNNNGDFEIKYPSEDMSRGELHRYHVTKEKVEPIVVDIKDIPEGISLDDVGRTGALIIAECEDIKKTLLEKNRKYGDSATRRGEIFGLSPVTAIKARIEDKLMRLKNDNKDEDEDITKDLLGYFILLRIAIKNEKTEYTTFKMQSKIPR